MAEYQKLLVACPCRDRRVILALTRIGGLRCPSEVIALQWADGDWEQNCFYVRSSKAEHHVSKEGRTVPIFPELKTELKALLSKPASRRKEFVIYRFRDPEQNLGGPFTTIRKEAGLPEIPRPFDNMRATRSNEIFKRFGAAGKSAWIGHSARTREAHYDMITEEDFEQASNWESVTCDTKRKKKMHNNFVSR